MCYQWADALTSLAGYVGTGAGIQIFPMKLASALALPDFSLYPAKFICGEVQLVRVGFECYSRRDHHRQPEGTPGDAVG